MLACEAPREQLHPPELEVPGELEPLLFEAPPDPPLLEELEDEVPPVEGLPPVAELLLPPAACPPLLCTPPLLMLPPKELLLPPLAPPALLVPPLPPAPLLLPPAPPAAVPGSPPPPPVPLLPPVLPLLPPIAPSGLPASGVGTPASPPLLPHCASSGSTAAFTAAWLSSPRKGSRYLPMNKQSDGPWSPPTDVKTSRVT